ncbi:MAG: hypothetical protein E7225_01830 [Clostridiales bacterium]|nr:hypothetical protein [Clostridiales bacterium]
MSGTMIKSIAMVTMFMSHLYTFGYNVPRFFLMIGRIAAPLFIFCAVTIGLNYTSSVRKYVWRLYLLTLLMEWINVMIYMGDYYHNFVRTILLIIVVITLLEGIIRKKKYAKLKLALFIIWQLITFAILAIMIIHFSKPETFLKLIATLTCSIFLLEGGIIYIILGVFMYFFRNDYRKLGIVMVTVSVMMFALFSTELVMKFDMFCHYHNMTMLCEHILAIIDNIFGMDPRFVERGVFAHPQWMMVFALPFILLYNREKESKINLKWVGYIFYPLHLEILYLIALSQK